MLVILLAFLVASQLRFGSLNVATQYLFALMFCLLLASLVMPATGAFRAEFRWEFFRKARRLLAGWAVVVMGLVTLAAMLKVSASYSRIWFGTWVLLGMAGLFVSLVLEHAWLVRRRRGRKALRQVVVVGGGDNGARVARRIEGDPDGEFEIVARFGDDWRDQPALPLSELAAFVTEQGIAEVWIAAPWDDNGQLEQALEALRESVIDINVVPDLHQYRLLNQGIAEWGGLPVINLSGTPMTGSELRIKAVFDWLGALALVILLSPLLLLVALLVRLTSPGPALFRQHRNGTGGERIEVLKFRTMKLHKEAEGQVTQATQDDDRITAVGRFLRRTSIDELPQLFNVLKGEMSLVGPRPHAVEHNDFFKSQIPRYMMRHKVKPGITGWAQVNGLRGITDTQEKMALRIEHDLWYIQNWSLWLDIRILLTTPISLLSRNAV
jgi:Undecaprenyl-phosphate glucose phosphotransferase